LAKVGRRSTVQQSNDSIRCGSQSRQGTHLTDDDTSHAWRFTCGYESPRQDGDWFRVHWRQDKMGVGLLLVLPVPAASFVEEALVERPLP
jgi:hypothetical protein